MELGLEGKVAIITGGSEGIGKSAASRLASEGARVAIVARRRDVLEDTASEIRNTTRGEVVAIPCDVTDPIGVSEMFEKVMETFGHLDILVNNAGTSAASPFETVEDDAWHYDLDLKLFGTIRCSRLAIPHMRKVGGGRIINVTALAGKAPAGATTPTRRGRWKTSTPRWERAYLSDVSVRHMKRGTLSHSLPLTERATSLEPPST